MRIDTWKAKANALKREISALYLCSRHPNTPWYAKVFAAIIVGYALTPIDLIPDFIPVIGYLDDLVLIPAGIMLLIKMIPRDVLEECRQKALSCPPGEKRKSWAAAFIIVCIWALSIYITFRFVAGFIKN